MKALFIVALLAVVTANVFAQGTWSGSTPGNIYYNQGWIGIGNSTVTPASLLHINSSVERQTFRIYKEGNTTNYLSIYQGTSGAAIDPMGTGRLYLGYDATTEVLMATNGGKVGIGTSLPASQLHITSNSDHAITISRNSGQYGFRIFRDATGGIVNFQIGNGASTWETKIRMGEGEGTNTALSLVPTNGNVLIGKTSQVNTTYKLDVNGSIRGNEIVVNSTGADFVFDSNYKLPTLEQVEEYIKANKHLPEIESADAMERNGLEVGKMEIKLLQKIEEMTLYIIELKKEVGDLRNKVDEMEKK